MVRANGQADFSISTESADSTWTVSGAPVWDTSISIAEMTDNSAITALDMKQYVTNAHPAVDAVQVKSGSSLPRGLSISGGGVVTGTPRTGTRDITFQARVGSGSWVDSGTVTMNVRGYPVPRSGSAGVTFSLADGDRTISLGPYFDAYPAITGYAQYGPGRPITGISYNASAGTISIDVSAASTFSETGVWEMYAVNGVSGHPGQSQGPHLLQVDITITA